MPHANRRVPKTGPRMAALILLLSASASGGFLMHADLAGPASATAADHPTQGRHHLFPGVPLGSNFQVSKTPASTVGVPTQGIAVAWRSDGSN